MEKDKWQLSADALDGDGGFADGKALIQYPRETDDKYKARGEVAYYVNHMRRACHRFVGYLSKQPASRNSKSEAVSEIIDNVDMQGNHISQFMQDFSLGVKARGSGLILVDMPSDTSGTEADQKTERNYPYFVEIKPEHVTDYEIDKFGRFEFIEFSSLESVDGDMKTVTRRYDKQGWELKEGKTVLKSGTYDIGVCPVVSFTETGSFPCVGSYYQIAELSKRIYNAQSELDEVLRNQTFSLLAYHIPTEHSSDFKPSEIAESVGTQNMLVYYGNAPEFISPDSGPSSTYREYIAELEARIDSVANNVDLGSTNQSGFALELRFQNMNSDLLSFARRLEDFERKLFDVVALWLRISNDVEISYPSDYNLIDKSFEIEVYQNMRSSGAPEAYLREKMKQIISADLVGMDAELETEINDQLNEATHERQ